MEQSNIGLFCDSFPPVMDGVSVCMQNYAYWMQRKVGGVDVITPNVPGADYSKLPYRVLDFFSVPVPKRHPYVTGVAEMDPVFLSKILQTRYKIVHAHCPFGTGLAAQRVARLQGIPCIGTFHSKYRDDFSRVLPPKVTDGIIKYIINFYEKCDLVWVPQASVIDVIRDYGFKGEVQVMDNGSDLVRQYPQEFFSQARVNLGIGKDEFVMLFVGQHIWEKNPRLILEALSRIKEIPFRMFFVGRGYAEEEIKLLAKDLGVDNKITFVGSLTDRDAITQYYAAADLFLFPSLYDNAPLVVREAAALNTPAVMARGATAAAIIADGENGFLTENDPEYMADLLEHLIANPEKVHLAGRRAAETVVRSWEDCVDEVLGRYNELLRTRGEEPICTYHQ